MEICYMLYNKTSCIGLDEFERKVREEIQDIWSLIKGKDYFRFGYPDVTPFEVVATYMAIERPESAEKYLNE